MPTVYLLVAWMLSVQPNGQLGLDYGNALFKDKEACEAKAKEFLKEQPDAQAACLPTKIVGKRV